MRDDNCIFCKLANGDIPTNSIYEDENCNVILDMSPATKGHALVIPKNHYANLYDIDPETLGEVVKVGQKVVKHVTPILGCEGYNLLQNNGEVAGQTVFHFHLHLVPRYKEGNDKTMLSFVPGVMDAEELKKLKDEIKLS